MIQKSFAFLLPLVLALALVPAGHAQDPSSPDPSPGSKTLYLHTNGDDSYQWMNVNRDDADADPATVSFYPASPTVDRTFFMDAGLRGPLHFAEGGQVALHMRFGSGIAANTGTLDVTLRIGETVLAEHSFDVTDANSYSSYDATVPIAVTEVDPSMGNLEFDVSFTGGGSAFMQVGQSGEYSSITLPVVAPPAPPAPPAEEPAEPVDTDGDGLTDEEEAALGTDPAMADTDGDGFSDKEEVDAGTDPNDPSSFPGSDAAADEPEESEDNNTTESAPVDSGNDGDSAAGRQVLSGFGFMTPLAEAIGMDSAFGDYAEPVMLGILILAFILVVVLLILLLGGSGPISLNIEPKRLAVVPGQTAEFTLGVRNRRRDSREVQAMFTGGQWDSSLELTPKDGLAPAPLTQPDAPAAFELTGKGQPGDEAQGIFRVHVPENLAVNMDHDVDLTMTPLGEDGAPLDRKARTVSARIRAAVPETSAISGLEIGEVMHEPALPRAGQAVETTCRIENNGPVPAPLRVVLMVDGTATNEQTIQVPAGGAATAAFPWKASGGRNNVKVQVFPA